MTGPATVQVRLAPALAVRVAATVVGAAVVLLALSRARTVLHWLVTAAVLALLLDGPVRALVTRRVRRGLAVTAVTVATLAGAGLLTYGVVDAVVEQYAALRNTAPGAVDDLVATGPLAGIDDRYDLVQRTTDLVDEAPERLFGTPASAARTAAERLGEVALVVTLAIFMLVAYERFEERVARLEAAGHAWRWRGVDHGLADGARGARRNIGRSLILGVLTAVVALATGAPAPAALGLWLAWWRLLPVLGIGIGYTPLLLLLVAEGQLVEAVAAAVVLAAAEAMTWWWSSRQGPGWTAAEAPTRFLSALGFFGGFELGGVTGATVAVVLVHVLVGLVAGATARPPPAALPAAPLPL